MYAFTGQKQCKKHIWDGGREEYEMQNRLLSKYCVCLNRQASRHPTVGCQTYYKITITKTKLDKYEYVIMCIESYQ